MPTLNWIGKDDALSHGDDADDGNIIVQGDNLHALKALLPKYAGKVRCIYIAPPTPSTSDNDYEPFPDQHPTDRRSPPL